MGTKRLRMIACGSLVIVAALGLQPQPASAATATMTVRGTVSCDNEAKVSGIWVASSGTSGGGEFVDSLVRYPGKPYVAVYHTSFTTTYPTSLRVDVGCGYKADGVNWASNNKSRSLSIGSSTSISINLWCTGNGGASQCRWGTAEDNSPAAPSTNPAARDGKCWCTYRAAEFWKQMTGRYPNWGGNAGSWGTNAKSTSGTDWTVSSVARPRSLVVKPGNPGHVGYVSDVEIRSGVVWIRVSDRNANNSCINGTQAIFDRTNQWMKASDFGSSLQYIVPPPVKSLTAS